MNVIHRREGRKNAGIHPGLLLAIVGCGGLFGGDIVYGQAAEAPVNQGIAQPYTSFVQPGGSPADEYFSQPFATYPEPGVSLTGESAAEALTQAIEKEPYEQRYGQLRVRTTAGVSANYTDNLFYSANGVSDLMLEPDGTIDALWPISQFNTLDLSLGVSYQYFVSHSELNPSLPLIDPGTELAINIFSGDFRIQLHEMFSYQESLFYNSFAANGTFFNFTNVGTFSRIDNVPGVDVLWDLNKAILTLGFDHEDFIATTKSFDYLDRSSEWLNGSLGFLMGDHAQIGIEGLGSVHNYYKHTVMDDNWRARVGPFADFALKQKIKLRLGGGLDKAQFTPNITNSDYSSFYFYGRISQETRLFTHSLEAGRQLLLGDNANNMKTIYVRYAISTDIIRYWTIGADFGVNVAEEFGGPSGYDEKFTYYDGGLQANWQFRKHWSTGIAYELLLKDSNLAFNTFHRNQLSLDLVWTF